MAKIKKGDRVIVLTGKDKGREGEVVKALPKEGKVVVSGVNMISRHTKPSQADPEGGIKQREAAIDVSNVAIKDPKTGKAARVGFEVRDGKKVRVLKGSGEVLNG
ncbi:50S ribosomal protein L24 [Sandaracinobacter sp. RS1-74]|uniref:50S ribosomal protein L24 n=1 Tax=Sandaracinobacteroides sayramensis TaxID=2913411 RepID=UPI00300C34C2|nr:50S ribosomal protein L24 [Sandaracinobacteroides sayramensis]